MPANYSEYTLRPIEPSDIHPLADLLSTPKLALTINRLLFRSWPNEPIQRSNYLSALEGFDSTSESLSVIDDQSGEPAGLFALNRRRPADAPSGNNPEGEESKQQLGVPDFFNQEVLATVGEAVGELAKEAKDIDNYELTYVIVHPTHRRQGIGKDLMQYAFNKANLVSVPLVVSAEPQIYSFFVHQGFQYVKHVDFDLAQWAPPYSGFGLSRLARVHYYLRN